MPTVGQVDLVTETTAKAILEEEKHRNALLALLAADSMATFKTDIKGIQSLVRNGVAAKVFNIGDQIVVPWTDKVTGQSYQVPLDVVHFGNVELKSGETVPAMYLQWHYSTPAGVMFDSFEAIYYAKEELPAGTYNFNVKETWSKALAGDYQFTLKNPVPQGGQIAGLKLLADTEPAKWKVQTFKNKTDTEPIEEAAVTSGKAGVSLGVLEKAGNAQLNSIHRAAYGYNRWGQSAIRQWLNSTAAPTKWWNPQNDYDRPPDQLATMHGFMSGFEKDFLDVLGTIKVTTALNTVTDTSEGATEVTYDKFFLPALEQIYAQNQLAGEGEYWEYWKRATGAREPQAWYTAYPERITYAINAQTSAQGVRLRSAYRYLGYVTWYVLTSGNVNNYYACNAYRCAPACVIC